MIYGVTICCEDVREEKPPLISLIGIMPDNLVIGEFPAALPRIAFYTRIVFTPDFSPKNPVRIMIRVPGAPEEFETQEIGALTLAVIDEAKQSVTGLCSAFSYAAAVNFLVPEAGHLTVYLDVDGEELVTGILNLTLPPANT